MIDGGCACLEPASLPRRTSDALREGLANGSLSALQSAFLRHGAAQCGICTPGFLVAASALLERNSSPDDEEIADALGGVLCRCTGYRKILAAVAEVARGNEAEGWQDPVAGRAVGAPVMRLDGVPKVSGAESFGADGWPREALAVAVVRSPHWHASFAFGDLDAFVAQRPGIEAVFTAADIPGRNRFGVIPAYADQRHSPRDGPVSRRSRNARRRQPRRDGRVRRVGLSGVLDRAAARRPDGEERTRRMRTVPAICSGRVRRGDPDTALGSSAVTVSGALATSYVEHAYVEPEAGFAFMDGETLVIRACTQSPFMDRDDTAAVLGLAPEKVRIVPTATGGGFGSKLDLSVQPLIGLVALKTGRPAALAYTRSESMASTTKRHPAAMRATIGADADGVITGMVFEGDFNTGAYASWGPTVAVRVPVHASGPYLVPNYRAVGRAIHTNGPISGAFRVSACRKQD